MRPGVRIGVDVGSVRVGVARSDATGTLAVPVETVHRGPGDVRRIVELAGEYDAIEVLVGLPLGLDGRRGAAAASAMAFADELASALTLRVVAEADSSATGRSDLAPATIGALGPDDGMVLGGIPVRLVDERLSTVSATRDLRAAGRSARSGRAVVDQAAAVVIVTYALDCERATGLPCGELLQET